MTVFWISAALLLLLALALVLPALLKKNNGAANTASSAAQANLSVLRSQLTQLNADFSAGSINAEQLALAKSDIERRALEEESAPETSVAPRRSSRTAWALGLAIPLLALGIYGFLGNIQALNPANLEARADQEPTPEQVEAMVSAFAARLEAVPANQTPDPKAWEMLARSYAAMQRFSDANKAYKRAVELNPGNAQILADHADVVAMLQGQSMAGEPTKLFERALVLDPNNIKALALAGSAAFEKKDFSKAVSLWSKAQSLAPPGSEFAKGLASSVQEAQAAAGLPMVAASPTTTSIPKSAVIEGKLNVSAALKNKIDPEDTVFIFARAAPTSANTPRMPLAILKRKASELPISFTLDDSTAMAEELKLSKFELVVIGARVSKSGNALPQSGDLIGQSSTIKVGGSPLIITIDSVEP